MAKKYKTSYVVTLITDDEIRSNAGAAFIRQRLKGYLLKNSNTLVETVTVVPVGEK